MHLFEFEDQSWFPQRLRQWQMDYIRFAVELLKPYRNIRKPWGANSPPEIWVDLASGSGGPVEDLHALWTSGHAHLIKTDAFPNDESVVKVDLCSDSYPRANFYTLFNAFHHFEKKDQLNIMSKMATADVALIAEPLSPSPGTFLGIFLLTGPGSWVLSPFVRPFSWARLFFTYVIPIVPLVTCWDGLVSVLRTPKEKNLRVMAKNATSNHFKWTAESVPFSFGRVGILIGKRQNV